MLKGNLTLLRVCDELKFVVSDRIDFETALEVLRNYRLRCSVYFSPVWREDGRDGFYTELAQWILEEELDVGYSLQLHKQIWSPTRRGV
jgi:7-carboxy-7-deazaguanine synthase